MSRPNSKKHSGNKIEIKIEVTYSFSNRIPVWESGRSVVNKEIDFHTKKKISARIRIKMAEFKIPNDIIIQSNSIVNMRKDNVGYLTYYVLKEGVEV